MPTWVYEDIPLPPIEIRYTVNDTAVITYDHDTQIGSSHFATYKVVKTQSHVLTGATPTVDAAHKTFLASGAIPLQMHTPAGTLIDFQLTIDAQASASLVTHTDWNNSNYRVIWYTNPALLESLGSAWAWNAGLVAGQGPFQTTLTVPSDPDTSPGTVVIPALPSLTISTNPPSIIMPRPYDDSGATSRAWNGQIWPTGRHSWLDPDGPHTIDLLFHYRVGGPFQPLQVAFGQAFDLLDEEYVSGTTTNYYNVFVFSAGANPYGDTTITHTSTYTINLTGKLVAGYLVEEDTHGGGGDDDDTTRIIADTFHDLVACAWCGKASGDHKTLNVAVQRALTGNAGSGSGSTGGWESHAYGDIDAASGIGLVWRQDGALILTFTRDGAPVYSVNTKAGTGDLSNWSTPAPVSPADSMLSSGRAMQEMFAVRTA